MASHSRSDKAVQRAERASPSLSIVYREIEELKGDPKNPRGDFVLIASEVNPVIKALRENGIEVTALPSHILEEQPRLFFMHFWANDDAQKLADGLKAALGKVSLKK